MPEYGAPSVIINETSFRSQSIEGVSTTTTGFVGQTLYGPIHGAPRLITSFEEFRRHFGGLGPLDFGSVPVTNYLAYSVKAFFENGGRRCYIARIYKKDGTKEGIASVRIGSAQINFDWEARYPGKTGNVIVRAGVRRSRNLLDVNGSVRALRGLAPGDVVETSDDTATKPLPEDVTKSGVGTDQTILEVYRDAQGVLALRKKDGSNVALTSVKYVQRLQVNIEVLGLGRTDSYRGLSLNPKDPQFIGNVLRKEDPAKGIEPPFDTSAMVYLKTGTDAMTLGRSINLVRGITQKGIQNDDKLFVFELQNGLDGVQAEAGEFEGADSTTTEGPDGHFATGLKALALRRDVAIVAAPTIGAITDPDKRHAIRDKVITHCEQEQYRIAVLCDAQDASTDTIRTARARHDSSHAALYYPWILVADPFGGRGDTIALPPDGFVAGIMARSDNDEGVHKAPANEIVRGTVQLTRHVTKGIQDVLNVEGINCIRYFEGRGYRLWGARTMSSDPNWKYVSTRRLFAYLEHSIDRSSQWAVFEPNNPRLWRRMQVAVDSFLRSEKRKGALLDYWVRCDETTNTPHDIDNGRMICQIGVWPATPAEYVEFQIGPWSPEAEVL